MKITITKEALLDLINKGIKNVPIEGISFKDTKVTDLTINSNWNATYELELVQDYTYSGGR